MFPITLMSKLIPTQKGEEIDVQAKKGRLREIPINLSYLKPLKVLIFPILLRKIYSNYFSFSRRSSQMSRGVAYHAHRIRKNFQHIFGPNFNGPAPVCVRRHLLFNHQNLMERYANRTAVQEATDETGFK